MCNNFVWKGILSNNGRGAKICWKFVCTTKRWRTGLKKAHNLEQGINLKLIWLIFIVFFFPPAEIHYKVKYKCSYINWQQQKYLQNQEPKESGN